MWGILSTVGTWLENLVGLVLPVAGKARASKGLGTTLYWVIHFLLLAIILVGLYFLNDRVLNWDRYIPRTSRFLAKSWLSILFLLVYVLAWLSWWLFKLLAPDQHTSDFPDIDEAWDEAVAAMNDAGITPTDAPLFLVLGRPEAPIPALFKAAQLKLLVTQVPKGERAPLHVFANRDAIYVSCQGVSLMARQSAILAGETETTTPGVEEGPEDDAQMQTLRPSSAAGGAQKIGAVLAQAMKKGRSPEQLTEAERRELRRLERKDKPKPSLLKNTSEVELLQARLEHLCRLIVRDRWPFCPANGILLLLPYAGTDSDQDALNTGEICQRELTVVRQALKVHCPMFALVCDMETAPGFVEFVERFSEAERQQRMGQRCPLVPALRSRLTANLGAPATDDTTAHMLDSLARWVCTMLLPGWIYKKFRLESPGKTTPPEVTKVNSRLFLLLDELRDRQTRLGSVLAHGLDSAGGEPWLFGGCYLGGTGSDPAREQAFVAGVFRRLVEEQNYVSWTEEALEEEALYQTWITRGYVALTIMGMAAVGLWAYSYLLAPTPKGPRP